MASGRLGRPRDERVDEALAGAVRELLAENGYQKITVDAIATRAEVGKPAIYRRHRSKAELIFSVIVHDLSEAAPADGGSLRADLRALLNRIHADLSNPIAGSVMSSLLSDVLADPELTARFRDTFIRAQRDVVAELCRRAVDRGELTGLPAPDFVHSLVLGPLFVRYVILGEKVPRSQLDDYLDAIMRALT